VQVLHGNCLNSQRIAQVQNLGPEYLPTIIPVLYSTQYMGSAY